jgi:hypothetical protein
MRRRGPDRNSDKSQTSVRVEQVFVKPRHVCCLPKVRLASMPKFFGADWDYEVESAQGRRYSLPHAVLVATSNQIPLEY